MNENSDGKLREAQKGESGSPSTHKCDHSGAPQNSSKSESADLATNLNKACSSNNKPMLLDLTGANSDVDGSLSEVLVSKLKTEKALTDHLLTSADIGSETGQEGNGPTLDFSNGGLLRVSHQGTLFQMLTPSSSTQSTPSRIHRLANASHFRSRADSTSTDISISENLTNVHLDHIQPKDLCTPNKRKLSNDSPAQQQTPKKQCQNQPMVIDQQTHDQLHTASCSNTDQNQQQASYADKAKILVAYIVPEDNSEVTQKQADHIRDSLITLLYPKHNRDPAPANFVQYGLTKSVFKVTCANEKSVQWLINQAHNIPPLDSLKFKSIEFNKLPKLICMSTYYPRKIATDLPTIRQRIARSNPQLHPISWKVFWAENKDHGVEVCYGIPQPEYDKLKKLNFKPYFELSWIELKPSRYYQAPPGRKRPPAPAYNRPKPTTDLPQQPSTQIRAAEHQAHDGTQLTWPNKTHDERQSNRPNKQKKRQKNASKQTQHPSNVSDETKINPTSNNTPSQPQDQESIQRCSHPALFQRRPNHASDIDGKEQRQQHTTNQGGRPLYSDIASHRSSNMPPIRAPPPVTSSITSPPPKLMSLRFDRPPFQHPLPHMALLPDPDQSKPRNRSKSQ